MLTPLKELDKNEQQRRKKLARDFGWVAKYEKYEDFMQRWYERSEKLREKMKKDGHILPDLDEAMEDVLDEHQRTRDWKLTTGGFSKDELGH